MASAPDPDRKRCAVHDISYGKLEQCSGCRAARGASTVVSSPKADTSDKRVRAAEARLRELACWDESKTVAREDGHLAVKWSAESGKWARLAMEIESQITELEHDQWLVEQKRKLGSGGN